MIWEADKLYCLQSNFPVFSSHSFLYRNRLEAALAEAFIPFGYNGKQAV